MCAGKAVLCLATRKRPPTRCGRCGSSASGAAARPPSGPAVPNKLTPLYTKHNLGVLGPSALESSVRLGFGRTVSELTEELETIEAADKHQQQRQQQQQKKKKRASRSHKRSTAAFDEAAVVE